jgi:hypothetical protein
MIHLFEDLVHFLGPDKRFWVLVVDPDELLDGFDQIRHAFKDTPPDALACDLSELPVALSKAYHIPQLRWNLRYRCVIS